MREQDQSAESDGASRLQTGRFRKQLWTTLLSVAAAITLLVIVGWRLMLPQVSASIAPVIPPTISEHDLSAITRLCRRQTLNFAVNKAQTGEVRWFLRSTRVLFRQSISRIFDDQNGTFRVYVVVYDKKEPDGFAAWSRHQIARTNGDWVILRSY
jgi:hypothetical protein